MIGEMSVLRYGRRMPGESIKVGQCEVYASFWAACGFCGVDRWAMCREETIKAMILLMGNE